MRFVGCRGAAAIIVLLAGCPASDPPANKGSTGDSGSDTSSGTFLPGQDTGSGGGSGTGSVADSSGGVGGDDSANNGECSLFAQDCPDGEKCAPWSETFDLVPKDIRCCPNLAPGTGLYGEPCHVQGYFGSCIDDCAPGYMCLDINNDGEGTCQKFCGGSPDNPECELDETCFIYFKGVPFCFRQCDPLVQDCNDDEGCYPDDSDPGGTGFACMPTVGGGKVGDSCWLLSNCEPGLLCVSPDFVPDCPTFAGCCSALCDITEPDTCNDIVPGTECVSWYYQGQMPPSADLVNVGACVIPP